MPDVGKNHVTLEVLRNDVLHLARRVDEGFDRIEASMSDHEIRIRMHKERIDKMQSRSNVFDAMIAIGTAVGTAFGVTFGKK